MTAAEYHGNSTLRALGFDESQESERTKVRGMNPVAIQAKDITQDTAVGQRGIFIGYYVDETETSININDLNIEGLSGTTVGTK
jgi:hypothetical protein